MNSYNTVPWRPGLPGKNSRGMGRVPPVRLCHLSSHMYMCENVITSEELRKREKKNVRGAEENQWLSQLFCDLESTPKTMLLLGEQ